MSNLFSGFFILGSDGKHYNHIPPSQIPKPFKQIHVQCKNGRQVVPLSHPQKNKADVAGFDGAIKMISTLTGQANPSYFYRLVCIYKDGTRWSTFYDTQGNVVGGEWS